MRRPLKSKSTKPETLQKNVKSKANPHVARDQSGVEKLHVADECVVCFDDKPNVNLEPCNHVCLCSECAELTITACPLCRSPIRAKHKLLKAVLSKQTPYPLSHFADGLARRMLCSKAAMEHVIAIYIALHGIAHSVTYLQFFGSIYIMADSLYLGLGMTTPAHDYIDTKLVWHLGCAYAMWQWWNTPSIRISKIHYEDSLINLRFHIRVGRDQQVVTWTEILYVIPKLLVCLFFHYILDMIGIWIGPCLLRWHHTDEELIQIFKARG